MNRYHHPSPDTISRLNNLGIPYMCTIDCGEIRTLPETDRALFARRYFLCENLREAAAALGLSESKAKSSLFRSRNKLRSYLEKEGFSL